MNPKSYMSLHNHTAFSNIRLKDAIIKVPDLLDNGLKLGLNGIAITDHEALSAHIKAKKYYNNNKDKFKDFKLAFGNEIYLVDHDLVEKEKENNGSIRFNHFILVAKNKHGYEGLMKMSTEAWSNGFFYHGLQRVPTYYENLSKIMSEYKGDIIASSACLGGIIPQLIIKYDDTKSVDDYNNIITELERLVRLFGEDDFYLELQPSNSKEQLLVNEYLVKISRAFNIKMIITTDSHYLNKQQKEIHKIYLQSNGNDNREVDSFYDTTYQMSADEILDFFEDKNLVQEMFNNTNEIMDKIEDYDFQHSTIIPQAHIPEFLEINLNEYPDINWDKYPSIKYYTTSKNIADKYYIKLIFDGLVSHELEFNKTNLSRIDTEIDVVKAVGDNFGMPLSSYFLVEREFIDTMWETSLVGVSRGSASSFFTNYLLDIVQINAIEYELPYWRFLNKDRLDNMPDIDEDSESSQRENIIEKIKNKFGNHNVINVGTFTTEKTRSSVLTACRGIGLSVEDANNILDLIPNDKGVDWSVYDTVFGAKNKKPVQEFIDEINKYPLLKETMLAIEGIVSGASQHASAVIVMNDGYVKHFPSMVTRNGIVVSQFDAHDVEYVGGLKFDFLSIDALSRIRSSMDLLLKNKKIKWQGSIKETYEKYLHPDNIDVNDSKIFKSIYNKEVPSIFQFSTNVGRQGLERVNPQNFDELAATNSLIRLTTDGEQPIDKYIRFKNDINEWYKEMKSNGLTGSEMDTLKNILLSRYGILDSQEKLMEISMDKNISNFSLAQANKLRKSVAKKDSILQEKEKELFFDMCSKNKASDKLASYVWNFCIVPQLGYSFSSCHVAGYTLIAIIEAYISMKYGSIYWKTASLSVDAGVQGQEFGGVDYVKLSRAVTASKSLIQLPDINKSDVGFVPNKNTILFGLGAISGISLDDINAIIDNRPYVNFIDFMDKVGKDFSQKKILTLVKSGVFHNFVESTRDLAIKYMYKYTERKKKLTTVQLPKIINHVPDDFYEAKRMYIFKNRVFGRNAIPMNSDLEADFFDNWEHYGVEYSYNDGNLVIDKKSFDKVFNKKSTELKEWLKTEDAIEALAKAEMNELWKKEMKGNEAVWYFSTLSYYPFNHELLYTNLDDLVDIDNFEQLPTEGTKNGKRTEYRRGAIAGTVINKNIKGVIDIVTTDDEVISVRVGKQQYGKYNKKIMEGEGKNRKLVSDSWFNRGTTLLFVGYRRGNDFIANKYKTGFSHAVFKIDGYNSVSLESK